MRNYILLLFSLGLIVACKKKPGTTPANEAKTTDSTDTTTAPYPPLTAQLGHFNVYTITTANDTLIRYGCGIRFWHYTLDSGFKYYPVGDIYYNGTLLFKNQAPYNNYNWADTSMPVTMPGYWKIMGNNYFDSITYYDDLYPPQLLHFPDSISRSQTLTLSSPQSTDFQLILDNGSSSDTDEVAFRWSDNGQIVFTPSISEMAMLGNWVVVKIYCMRRQYNADSSILQDKAFLMKKWVPVVD